MHYLRRLFRRRDSTANELLIVSLSVATNRGLGAINDGALLDLAHQLDEFSVEIEPGETTSALRPIRKSEVREVVITGRSALGWQFGYRVRQLSRVNLIVANTVLDAVGWQVPLSTALLSAFRVTEGAGTEVGGPPSPARTRRH